ncbi:MAG: type IV-A pilus assembly ATPase PilB [Deltaproteobacteria bacterium]|nr:type IV-A pilus assembly ATPase PilB [Deltaproteobacteria bacterium]MBW2068123.1 type IV-A pilus assembly ATPase PilB [Deltaproteobacteria bacterium]
MTQPSTYQKLGQILVKGGYISKQQLQDALNEQRRTRERLGAILIKQGLITEQDLAIALARQLKLPLVNPLRLNISQEVRELILQESAEKYMTVPFGLNGNVLHVATSDPTNRLAADDLRFLTQKTIRFHVATESSIKAILEQQKTTETVLDEALKMLSNDAELSVIEETEDLDLADIETATEDAPIVRLVNSLLADAINRRASDIHIEPYEKMLRVRYRIDGVLYEVMRPPVRYKNAIVSRIKIMSNLDIAERRLPQDGRIKAKIHGREVDFRVSCLPTLFGEKVVLRILDKSNLQLDMTQLGFEKDQLEVFKNAIYQPYGMVLVTGPTGSGKTTTLYSALTELNKVERNISTAEDPVEYNLPGINQVQVNDSIGLTFATALRAFLRQDPDIIMVGEIRDLETAEIAVKAALTGHLVLSTLHTNDAPSTVTRLINMGVEPFLIASALNLVLAQRLVRKLCDQCKTVDEVPPDVLLDLGVPEREIDTFECYRARGCSACNNTGYRGRVALYEVMPMYEELRELVLAGASAAEIRKEAIRLGMKTLRQSGIEKVKEGITSIEEVVRTTSVG